jgi:hypothetical protein
MWKLSVFIQTALLFVKVIPVNTINVSIMELSCLVLLSFQSKGGMKEVQLYYIPFLSRTFYFITYLCRGVSISVSVHTFRVPIWTDGFFS